MIEALVFGLHLHSVHIPNKDYHNNSNLGAYVRMENVTLGGYRNSYGRATYYAGYSHPLGAGFEVMAGAATGYQRKCKTEESRSVQTRQDGKYTVTTTDVTTTTDCNGFGRGKLAPLVGITYSPGILVAGMRPRLWLAPGVKGSSTVIHLSAEF